MNNLVSDVKPLMVRMMWDEPSKKPDYMPRVMKFYISYLVKTIKLNIFQMSAPMMKLNADLSEVIRICAGNVRPYLKLSSSRLIVAQELFDALKKEGELTCKWDKVNIVLCKLEEYPWLKAQFCVALLSNQYLNLNKHFHKGKYKLSKGVRFVDEK